MIPKFRAWDKKHKQMIRVISLNWYEEITDYNVVGLFPNTESVARFWDETIVMQSTGLLDVNGVEIFEGDILTTEQYPYQVEREYNYHGVVEWDKESAGYIVVKYVVNPLISGVSNGMADRFEEVDGFEVIGNIRENPELLEVAE